MKYLWIIFCLFIVSCQSAGKLKSFEDALNKEQYNEAFSRYSKEKTDQMDIWSKVEYDFLNILINKNPDHLLCLKHYKEFPNAYAPSIILCKILFDVTISNKYDNQDVLRLESYFKHVSHEKSYILKHIPKLLK